ncbi:MAG: hypothetical protein Q8N88_04300, partial [Nanoarchaeota archaeon]|nr:hypothetical protein [Nanoarchaeota archaeon]
QMKTFIYHENKQPTAEQGYSDDLLMAVFLGFFKVVFRGIGLTEMEKQLKKGWLEQKRMRRTGFI